MGNFIMEDIQVVVLISANAEWNCVQEYFKNPTLQKYPFGTWFSAQLAGKRTILAHGGWGKISASASAQYAIDHWKPKLIINIGTCGGLNDLVEVGEVLLVEKTLVYDIYERMGNPETAITSYSTDLDLSFLCQPFPQKVTLSRLLSADQDIDPDLVFKLTNDYQAIAADWESGAIAWTCARNRTHCLILRVVSDLVDPIGGEIYHGGNFETRVKQTLLPLIKALPNWIRCAFWGGAE
jgi:adenosylhomocysteine nucleosidase